MPLPAVLIRLAPVALRVVKLIVVAAPHLVAAYQHHKQTKLLESRKSLK